MTQYVYDEVDRLTERTLPNGVETTYGYDDRDRVLSVVHRGPLGNVLASVVYERSASGEPTKITREDGSYVVLTYDAALRLDTETYYDDGDVVVDAIDYGYDLDGKRTSKDSLSGGYESYGYQPGFKLATITTPSGTESYGYDSGGRNTSIARGGVSRTLEYSSDDKVTRVVDGGSEVVAFSYDGAGRRVAKTEGGATTRFLVAPNLGDGFETPQAVTDGTGTVLASYVFAGEQPIARIVNGQVEYYLQDAMGSVIGMADASGASTASIKYDAFGNVISAVGASAGIPSSVGTDFRYHGMQFDARISLYEVRARTYDARTGRFTSRDPVAGHTVRPETQNPYTLDFNNPLKWRDPSGREGILDVMMAIDVASILSSIAMPSFPWANLRPLDDANSVAALERARTKNDSLTPGKALCAWRALDVAEMRRETTRWYRGLSEGYLAASVVLSQEVDAFGHCWAGCDVCRKCGPAAAEFSGELYEDIRDLGIYPAKFPWIGPHDSSKQDRANQRVGREMATIAGTCAEGCNNAYWAGRLDLTAPPLHVWSITGRYWTDALPQGD